MADELEALGGGDASAGRLVACCRVAPRTRRPASGLPIVTAGRDGTVAVRDPRAPADAPAERVVRRYRASSALGPEAGVEEVRGPPTALTGTRPPDPLEHLGTPGNARDRANAAAAAAKAGPG